MSTCFHSRLPIRELPIPGLRQSLRQIVATAGQESPVILDKVRRDLGDMM
jgi:hypothetical protein